MNPFEKYTEGYNKFLDSEGGEIYVRCETFDEALFGLQELMKMVDYKNFYALAYNIQDRIYYWEIHKSNTVFCLEKRRSSICTLSYARKRRKKGFSYKGFYKRLKYFMYIYPKNNHGLSELGNH